MLVGAFQKTILLMPIFEKQTPPPLKTPKSHMSVFLSYAVWRWMIQTDIDYH